MSRFQYLCSQWSNSMSSWCSQILNLLLLKFRNRWRNATKTLICTLLRVFYIIWYKLKSKKILIFLVSLIEQVLKLIVESFLWLILVLALKFKAWNLNFKTSSGKFLVHKRQLWEAASASWCNDNGSKTHCSKPFVIWRTSISKILNKKFSFWTVWLKWLTNSIKRWLSTKFCHSSCSRWPRIHKFQFKYCPSSSASCNLQTVSPLRNSERKFGHPLSCCANRKNCLLRHSICFWKTKSS